MTKTIGKTALVWGAALLAILLVFYAILLVLGQYYVWQETALWSDTAQNGAEVEVVQKGHSFLKDTQELLIRVDGKAVCSLTVRQSEALSLYDKNQIRCIEDSAEEYTLLFPWREEASNVDSRISFTADFKTILRVESFWFTLLEESVQVVEKIIHDPL